MLNNLTRPKFGWSHTDQELAIDGVIHRHFSNPTNFADYMTENQAGNTSPWYSGGSLARGIKLLAHGDDDLIEQTREIMKQLHANLPTTQRQWQTAPVGFFPNVPAYLSGEPENMFTVQRNNSDSSPVRIWVNVLPSGGCDRPTLLKRGAVLVALAQLLLERRSLVRITCYGDQPASGLNPDGKTYAKGVIVSWDLPTSPLNLSMLCTSLGYPEVVQNVTFTACHSIHNGVTGGWLRGHCPGYTYNEGKVRQDLGAEDEDVIIPAAFLGDELHNKPVDFLHRELTRILGESENGDY